MNDGRIRKQRRSQSVAGRIVYIRHATEWDLDMIRNTWKVSGQDFSRLDPERVVVAAEEDVIIGFGIRGKPTAEGNVCITVFEKRTRRGIGSSIVRHMLENEPQITGLHPSDERSQLSLRPAAPRKRPRSSAKKSSVSTACSVSGRSRPSARRGLER